MGINYGNFNLWEDRRNRLIVRTITLETRSWNISEIAGPRQPDGAVATSTQTWQLLIDDAPGPLL